jgi:hypothetical protein
MAYASQAAQGEVLMHLQLSGETEATHRIVERADAAWLNAARIFRKRKGEKDLAVGELDALLQEKRHLDTLILQEPKEGLAQLDPIKWSERLRALRKLLHDAVDPRVYTVVVNHSFDVFQVR